METEAFRETRTVVEERYQGKWFRSSTNKSRREARAAAREMMRNGAEAVRLVKVVTVGTRTRQVVE